MADLSKRTRVVLSFSDIFDEDERDDISNLISDIPSKQALQIVAHFSARYHGNEHDLKIHGEALVQWLGRLDLSLKTKVLSEAAPHMERENFLFINQPSCLYLIQEIILNYNDLKERELTPEDELNLFKAYMLASEWSVKISSEIQEKGINGLSNFVEVTLKTQLPISDLKFSREFYLQAYKAISFFEFSETNKEFNNLITDFIASTKSSNWKEYLKSILHIYVTHLLKFNEPNRSVVNFEEENQMTEFLDYLTLDKSKFEAKSDFISIREKPVFKLQERSYLFLNLDLFIDKIFSGILFDIYSAISENQYDGIDTSNFGNFKSFIGESFIEEVLLYEILNYVKQDSWISFSGKKMRENIDGEPDFYIRRRSKVFLFECKDTLIRSDTKNSYDIKVIEKEINKKLIRGTQQKNKGVSQILSFISKLEDGLIQELDEFNYKYAKYYPIIVVTDRALDEHGINYFFNSSFNDLIRDFSLDDFRIQKPVLIQLDDLLKFADLFKNEYLKFNSILDAYIAQGNTKDYFIKSYSFSDYLKEQAFKFSKEPTKLIDEKLKVIFD